MEHALPRRTAGIPRTWSLCMTSENHGTVGPAGCKFSHAPEKHERVLVVEVPTAAGAPADQINIRLVGARQDLPVAEFEGYVDGEPLVRWMDRDNMPRVGTKLFTEAAANKAEVDLSDVELADPEYVRAYIAGLQEIIEDLSKRTPTATTGASTVLTDERIAEIASEVPCKFWHAEWFTLFARAIEREVAAQAGHSNLLLEQRNQTLDELQRAHEEIKRLEAQAGQVAVTEIDIRDGFERWMSNRGEAVNYAGDGMYEYSGVNKQADAFRAGVEYAITAKPSPDKSIFTEEDHNMLHAVAGYMRRSESPRCSNDLINLAERLRDSKQSAAPSPAKESK